MPTAQDKLVVVTCLKRDTQAFLENTTMNFPICGFMIEKLNLENLLNDLAQKVEEGSNTQGILTQIKHAGNLLNFVAITYEPPLQREMVKRSQTLHPNICSSAINVIKKL